MKTKLKGVFVCCAALALNAAATTPVITSQPQSLTINNASTANFAVSAENAASYQWNFGTNVIEGATNATLTLDDVVTNQAGIYTVVITSSTGESTNSQPAQLSIVPGTIVQLTISKYADGSSSNIVVQLFDHDKPATVANFIHYVTSGAYSNMFFDRCVPGFVLQGGTYDGVDRTNSSPGLHVFTLLNSFRADGANSGIPFPDQVDSEFGDGPFIPNTFGTLAMALSTGESNSATSAFFINLADNSADLDFQSGGFTVFGRILSGTNVLRFFNTLTNGLGIIDYEEFVTNAPVPTLPVNYAGTNEPANTNLFFCDFALANPPIYNTNLPPTVSVTSPPAGQYFTNGGSIVLQGTAGTNQWTGLSRIRLDLSAQNGAELGQPLGNDAIGTSNWYLPASAEFGVLPPGQYDIRAVAQDGYGLLGTPDTSSYFTVLASLAIETNGVGTTQVAPAPMNLSGTYLIPGTDYTISAVPGAGHTFYTWANGGGESSDQSITVSGSSDQTLTVTFIATNLPTGLAITIPDSSEKLNITNGIGTFTGSLPAGISVTQLTCQLFTRSVAVAAPQPATVNGTTWSLTVSNLSAGAYTVYALAYDSIGRSGLVSRNFNATEYLRLTVVTNGLGSISPEPSGPYVPAGSYTFKAVPKSGQLFYNWSDGVTQSINPRETIDLTSNETVTVTFVSNNLPGGISFTYPTANEKVPTNTIALTGKVAASAGLTTITAQLFSKTTSNSVTNPMVTTGSSTWSIPAVQLAPGDYIVEALASNAVGKTTVISEEFTVLTPLSVSVTGPGTTSITNGTYLQSDAVYSIKATPNKGQLFYYWSSGAFSSISPVIPFRMTEGLGLTATFLSNALPNEVAFTYPANKSHVATNTFALTGTDSASLTNGQILLQLFSGGIPATPGQYATFNGSNWSVTLSNLQQGNYTAVAVATDSEGGQTLISETFTVNIYPTIAGTYYGVFFTTNIATNNAGFFKLTLDGTGVMSGKLQFPVVTYTVYYALGPSGGVELSGGGLTFDVNFDLTNGSDTVTGFVDAAGTYAPFTGYRAATMLPSNAVAGRYVLDLETITNQAAAGPTNDGFAAVTIGSTGGVTLAGTLADNTPVSEGVGISKSGVWPVFVPLYARHGVLIGWETNVIGPDGAAGATGTLYWAKAPTRDTYFTNGFNLEAASTGTDYVAPIPGAQYQVVFGGGSVNPPLSNMLTVSASRQFEPEAGAADKLVISLSAAGVITGTIFNPADSKTLQIRGAFSNPTVGAAGFTLDTYGETDPFEITPIK